MRVHVGNITTGKKEGDALDGTELLLSLRNLLPQCQNSIGQILWQVLEAGDMGAGNYEHMARTNRTKIEKGHQVGILENDVRFGPTFRDFAEQAGFLPSGIFFAHRFEATECRVAPQAGGTGLAVSGRSGSGACAWRSRAAAGRTRAGLPRHRRFY